MNSAHLLSIISLALAEPSAETPADVSESAYPPAIVPPQAADSAFDAGAAHGKQCTLCRMACIHGPKSPKDQGWKGSSLVSDPACGQNRPRCDEGIAYGWDESHKDQPEEVKKCYDSEYPKMVNRNQFEGPPPIGCSRCDTTSGDSLAGIGLLALVGLTIRRRRR